MTELSVLQAVRLKGRVTPADLAKTLRTDDTDVAETVGRLAADGLLVAGPTLRITPEGRSQLAELLAAERRDADAATLADAYDKFRSINAEFKALVTAWQLKDGQPNNHEDADYDAAVLARLDGVHQRAISIVATVTAQLPRLSSYPAKLSAALDRVKSGEISWLTRPLIDSYHTVWFELHEELILAVGLTREQAAKSDDAH
jgi:DNA-binding MarR family transcriptional regulator